MVAFLHTKEVELLPTETDDELTALAQANREVAAGNSPAPLRCTLPVSITPWDTVRIGGIDVPDSHLTKKEVQLLELILIRGPVTVTKEQLFNALYAGRDEPELKIIDVFVCKLRKKLGEHGPKIIKTVWGRGYLRGDGYSWQAALSASAVSVDIKTREFLEVVAAECDPKRHPDELANELLQESLKALRAKLWG